MADPLFYFKLTRFARNKLKILTTPNLFSAVENQDDDYAIVIL